jgi:hypothetical protein
LNDAHGFPFLNRDQSTLRSSSRMRDIAEWEPTRQSRFRREKSSKYLIEVVVEYGLAFDFRNAQPEAFSSFGNLLS